MRAIERIPRGRAYASPCWPRRLRIVDTVPCVCWLRVTSSTVRRGAAVAGVTLTVMPRPLSVIKTSHAPDLGLIVNRGPERSPGVRGGASRRPRTAYPPTPAGGGPAGVRAWRGGGGADAAVNAADRRAAAAPAQRRGAARCIAESSINSLLALRASPWLSVPQVGCKYCKLTVSQE